MIGLDFSNYATKKELDHATGVDTSDWSAKKDFIALKANVNDFDVVKLKAVPVDLKKLSDVVDNEVVKNAKFNTLKAKVNNLERRIPDATTLIYIN